MTTKQFTTFSLLFLLLFLALNAAMMMEGSTTAPWPASALPVAWDELLRLNQ